MKPVFTQEGSFAARPFEPMIVYCLDSWLKLRTTLIKIQLTREIMERIGDRRIHVFGSCIDVFAESVSGQMIEERIEKPVDAEELCTLYDRFQTMWWAFGIATVTFSRGEQASAGSSMPGSDTAGPRSSAFARAVVVFDLRERRLAGVCFVPPATESADGGHPLSMLVLAGTKLREAFHADKGSVHIISPVNAGEDMAFLPWLVYALRDAAVQEAIRACISAPASLRLMPAELLFWGLPSCYDQPAERRAASLEFPQPEEQFQLGINFRISFTGRDLDIGFRVYDAGVDQGHHRRHHLDIQLLEHGLRSAPLHADLPSLHGLKLVDHLPVDLARFRGYGLRSPRL